MNSTVGVILAAGMGTRMRSQTVKVLHPLSGRPMLEHVIQSVQDAGISRIVVVVGHQGDRVQQTVRAPVEYVVQREQLGTGHAVMQAVQVLKNFAGHGLITYGDTPLYRPETFRRLLKSHTDRGAQATVLSTRMDDPTGYGRVVRDEKTGGFRAIVEQRDITSPEIERIDEINTGTYCFEMPTLFHVLGQLSNDNEQGEYYLPDVLTILLEQNARVDVHQLDDPTEALGINDRRQLAVAEGVIRARKLDELMKAGVTIVDPATTVIHHRVRIGADTVVYPFTVIEGETSIGHRCHVGPHAVIRNCRIGHDVVIEGATIKDSHIEDGAVVESFVYLGPNCHVTSGERVAATEVRGGLRR